MPAHATNVETNSKDSMRAKTLEARLQWFGGTGRSDAEPERWLQHEEWKDDCADAECKGGQQRRIA